MRGPSLVCYVPGVATKRISCFWSTNMHEVNLLPLYVTVYLLLIFLKRWCFNPLNYSGKHTYRLHRHAESRCFTHAIYLYLAFRWFCLTGNRGNGDNRGVSVVSCLVFTYCLDKLTARNWGLEFQIIAHSCVFLGSRVGWFIVNCTLEWQEWKQGSCNTV